MSIILDPDCSRIILSDKGVAGPSGDLVIKIEVSVDSEIDVSVYNSIILVEPCTISFSNENDLSRMRVFNGSGGNCTIEANILGDLNPVIYPNETFDMEYSSTLGSWSL